MGVSEKEEGKREFISTQGNCSHSVCASASEISAFFVRPFPRFSSIQENTFHTFPSFDSFKARTPRATATSISVGERGLVTQFSFPLLSSSPSFHHPVERTLSNTMQHPPPIHRCFSHPLIALLDVISDKRILWRLE